MLQQAAGALLSSWLLCMQERGMGREAMCQSGKPQRHVKEFSWFHQVEGFMHSMLHAIKLACTGTRLD